MKADHSIAQLCAALDVSRSGYHAWAQAGPSARATAATVLLQDIRQIHTEHRGRYGAPRIQEELHRRGQRHGTKRSARLLRAGGLRGRSARRYVPRTTASDHDHPIAPNRLAQTPAPTGPNQVWVSDLTYVETAEGWLYVAVILDLWSRRVVWAGAPAPPWRPAPCWRPCAWPWPTVARPKGCCTTVIAAGNMPAPNTGPCGRRLGSSQA